MYQEKFQSRLYIKRKKPFFSQSSASSSTFFFCMQPFSIHYLFSGKTKEEVKVWPVILGCNECSKCRLALRISDSGRSWGLGDGSGLMRQLWSLFSSSHSVDVPTSHLAVWIQHWPCQHRCCSIFFPLSLSRTLHERVR